MACTVSSVPVVPSDQGSILQKLCADYILQGPQITLGPWSLLPVAPSSPMLVLHDVQCLWGDLPQGCPFLCSQPDSHCNYRDASCSVCGRGWLSQSAARLVAVLVCSLELGVTWRWGSSLAGQLAMWPVCIGCLLPWLQGICPICFAMGILPTLWVMLPCYLW